LKFCRHSSHDIVLLCAECHEIYETEATKFKKEISKKYSIPIDGQGTIIHLDIIKIQKEVFIFKIKKKGWSTSQT
jgi:hypothetical protein